MLDFGYFHGVNQLHYLILYTLTMGLVLIACIQDLRNRKVSNKLWIWGLIFIIPSIFIRNWTWDIIYIPTILLCSYALVRSGAWGMGDAKGISLISFIIGALPTIFIIIIAWLLMKRKKNEVEQPFFHHVMISMVCFTGVIIVWLIRL